MTEADTKIALVLEGLALCGIAGLDDVVGDVIGATSLSPANNELLLSAFHQRIESFGSVSAVLKLLERCLSPDGFAQLSAAARSTVPVFGCEELARVLAYARFAEEVLKIPGPLPLEVRIEGWKAYALIPAEFSLLQTVAGRPLLWVHDEEWAAARFRDDGVELGLCGQLLGRSKFVTPCDRLPTTKGDALDILGLRGYPAFDKPGTMHVVRAAGPEILAAGMPQVPLLYNVGSAGDASAAAPDVWKPQLRFQEGAFPGYTSGLQAELVMRTFQLDVKSVAELNAAGVECLALAD